jgi:two-component system OmpR family sensor kinase
MNKLWIRLSLAFGAVVMVAAIILVVGSMVLRELDDERSSFAARILTEPDGLLPTLAGHYQVQQGWEGVEPLLVGAQSIFFIREQALVLTGPDGDPIAAGHDLNVVAGGEQLLNLPIEVNGQTVGYLQLVRLKNAPTGEGFRIPLRAMEEMFRAVALLGGVGGVIFGIIMSRTLTTPLNHLAEAARDIGARKLERRVKEEGTDEIITVARAFNEMAADLQQAEQLRRNLLADVAHELRTPLTVLQANLRAILDEVYPLEQGEIARLYDQTRFLSRLVNDLHELAQAEAQQLALDRQPADPGRLAQSVANTFRPAAEAKKITLRLELADDLPQCEIDFGRMQQVLQNLLANALRYTPAGGSITLTTAEQAGLVRLSVADTGPGIPPEHLPHIFDRFYRADPARSHEGNNGAGLGLAIARAIVQLHGGEIKVGSAVGEGTEFVILLP